MTFAGLVAELFLECGKAVDMDQLACRFKISVAKLRAIRQRETPEKGRYVLFNGRATFGQWPLGVEILEGSKGGYRGGTTSTKYRPSPDYLREALIVVAMCEGIQALNDPFQGYEGFGDPASRLVHLLEKRRA